MGMGSQWSCAAFFCDNLPSNIPMKVTEICKILYWLVQEDNLNKLLIERSNGSAAPPNREKHQKFFQLSGDAAWSLVPFFQIWNIECPTFRLAIMHLVWRTRGSFQHFAHWLWNANGIAAPNRKKKHEDWWRHILKFQTHLECLIFGCLKFFLSQELQCSIFQ